MNKLLRRLITLGFLFGVGEIAVRNKACTKEEAVLVAGVVILLYLAFRYTKKQRLLHSTLKKIDQMDGVQFEEYLLYQFKRRGYRVMTTPMSGDFGADLILKKRRKKYVVQVKRYSGSVGLKAVQEIIGAKQYYDIENGIVITNSYFTKGAMELAEASEVELWDRDDLVEQFGVRAGYWS